MTKPKGLLRDTHTGRLRATQSFRDHYSAAFGRVGIDLSKPIKNDRVLMQAAIDMMDDDACDALAEALGLMNKGEEGGD